MSETATQNVTKILASSLPEAVFGPNLPDSEAYVKSFLVEELPSSEKGVVNNEMKWHFILDKQDIGKAKNKKKPHKRKAFLSRKERARANLLKLQRDGWNYNQLESLRELWRNYMRDNLDGLEKVPTYLDPEWQAFTVVLGKSELVGAEVEVVQSKVPSLVGQSGTVVLETKSTIQVVTPDDKLKILLKQQSVFAMELDGVRFTIFGKYINTKPSERSVKKIKTIMYPDL